MRSLSSRKINLIGFLICSSLVLLAFYIEHHYGLQPCLLCILQRTILGALGLVFLIAFLHNPKSWGVRLYGLLCLLLTGLGTAAAYRQVWLQNRPPQPGEVCVPGMSNPLILNHGVPSHSFLKQLIQGTSECGQVLWSLFGLSMAEWTFIFFILLAVFSLKQIIHRKGFTS
jgi:protein dithiol:quinone oxidoreductase